MKRQEMFIVFALAVVSVWVFQLFFTPRQPSNDGYVSGQRVTAPKQIDPLLNQPLVTEIDFVDTKIDRNARITEIETPHARYQFTTHGGALEQVEFRRPFGGKSYFMNTLAIPSGQEREKLTFLLALDEKTPFNYELVSHDTQPDRHVLTYRTSIAGGSITKIFTVYQNVYRIDCTIAIQLTDSNAAIKPRLFFASPLIADLASQDAVSGIANEGAQKVQIIPKREDTFASYWAHPTLFGAQDRYFVHALVKDENNFVQRGYFKAVDLDRMYAILEGSSITQSGEWHLSFYFGPKEDDAMYAVDPRLEYTLNYGWFSFISKPLSKVLLDILNWLNKYVHSYGWALVIVVILFRLLLFPFTYERGGARKKRAEFQKKLEHIQSKYKHDPQALAQARAELIRTHGMPGLGGCLVAVIQLPMFWALSIILANAIELYKAPFLWITDLSSPDHYFILPILAAIGIMVHVYTTATDARQRFSSMIMALVVGAFLANLAAGLTLYIVISTFLGVLQTFVTQKRVVV